jgi:hypothetical protein
VSCEAVGYGTHTENGIDTYEAKRNGTEIVKAIAASSIEVSMGTTLADHGDSGGPLICAGVVAGATSCHTDGDWPGHQNEHYARIDPAAAWITSQTQAWGASAADAGVQPDAAVDADAGSAACGHDPCATGTKLVAACDPCVSSICAADSYCCATSWDSICVGEVKSVCGKTCH